MPNRQLFLKASTTAQYVGRIVDEQLSPIGIPGFLLALLTHVRDNAPVSPSTVSLASGVPATTLRDNIQRLVDRRLVRRIPNPDDGRSYLLVLTRRGETVLQAADPALLEAYLALERRLRLPLEQYELMLDELNDALQAMLEPDYAAR
jgi:DNA-binding MarR family transcriptional regulator